MRDLKIKVNTLQHAITVMQRHHNKWDGIDELSETMFQLLDELDNMTFAEMQEYVDQDEN